MNSLNQIFGLLVPLLIKNEVYPSIDEKDPWGELIYKCRYARPSVEGVIQYTMRILQQPDGKITSDSPFKDITTKFGEAFLMVAAYMQLTPDKLWRQNTQAINLTAKLGKRAIRLQCLPDWLTQEQRAKSYEELTNLTSYKNSLTFDSIEDIFSLADRFQNLLDCILADIAKINTRSSLLFNL